VRSAEPAGEANSAVWLRRGRRGSQKAGALSAQTVELLSRLLDEAYSMLRGRLEGLGDDELFRESG
jgi:hypothetical protein